MPDEAAELGGAAADDVRIAEARSAAYALFSQLVASPFDAPSLAAALPPEDLPEVAAELRVSLPYELDLGPLIAAAQGLREDDAERLARVYSALFEVGSEGAPVALREEHAGLAATGSKEEVVRYYEFFGYALAPQRQWAPDHLAVELEFLHFLAFREAREEDPERLSSYRLAERDFLQRHPLLWFPEVLRGVSGHAREPYWRALFEALGAFLEADAAWQRRRHYPAG